MSTNFDGRFPAWLSARLERLDLRAADLSREMGVHKATVSRWLSGEREPDDGLISGLAGALRVQRAELYVALGRIAPDEDPNPLEADILYEVRALPVGLQMAALDMIRSLRRYWEESQLPS